MANLSFTQRLKHAYDVFRYSGEEQNKFVNYGVSTTVRPDRARLHISTERSIITSLYNRIATDVAAVPIKHVRVNQNGNFIATIDSGLNDCLNVSANLDQTGRELIYDAVISMFDEGVVALVPVETSMKITNTNSYDILSMRVGKIMEWYPANVKLEVYDERVGSKRVITLPKDKIAIIENPFYSVMNEKNSTLQRLIHKLNLLDNIDEQSGSSKLDLLIQMPYAVKSEARKKHAEDRKNEITDQLKNSEYGIAYIDSTENITQLNRPIENNLMSQIEYLTSMLYSQLGVTKEVFEGTADEATTLNYYNSTIEPVLSAFTGEMLRKFLTKTARSQGQSIKFLRDPFRLVPVKEMADIADKFTRNEILSGNEMRSIVGYKPVDDPRANELRNKNLNASDTQLSNPVVVDEEEIY